MGVAGILGLVAFLLVIEGIVFGIATMGLALHWSCLMVAAVMAVAAGAFYALGAAKAREELTPTRTIRQVKQDIATAKEQLT
jgi:membrane protein implicated in regulation of membrane protease activity